MSLLKDRAKKEPTTFIPSVINYGINLLKINKIEIKKSKGTRILHTFHVETKPITSSGFKPYTYDDGDITPEGKVGWVALSQYFDPESKEEYDVRNKNQFLNDLSLIAEKMEILEKLDDLDDDTPWQTILDRFVEEAKGKYAWYLIAGEEFKEGRFNLSFGSTPVGKDDDGNYEFSVIVKHEKFYKDFVKNENGIIIELKGVNQVGDNKGKKYALKFNPKFHLETISGSGSEDEFGEHNDDLPF